MRSLEVLVTKGPEDGTAEAEGHAANSSSVCPKRPATRTCGPQGHTCWPVAPPRPCRAEAAAGFTEQAPWASVTAGAPALPFPGAGGQTLLGKRRPLHRGDRGVGYAIPCVGKYAAFVQPSHPLSQARCKKAQAPVRRAAPKVVCFSASWRRTEQSRALLRRRPRP